MRFVIYSLARTGTGCTGLLGSLMPPTSSASVLQSAGTVPAGLSDLRAPKETGIRE